MAILIISARIILVFPIAREGQLNIMKEFSTTDNYSMLDKLNMYTNLLNNMLFFSDFEVYEERIATTKLVIWEEQEAIVQTIVPAIRQVDTTVLNITGVLVFGITILSFILNRKDIFSRLCFIWVIFSFVLLCILGWGTVENGLLLYSFYFLWAFICLIYKLFEKLLEKHEKVRISIYTTLAFCNEKTPFAFCKGRLLNKDYLVPKRRSPASPRPGII